MQAVEVLPADMPHAEWLAARREVLASAISASEVAALMGLSSYESPLSLFHRKRGELAGDRDHERMRWGRRLEALIAAEFADQHSDLVVVRAGTFRHAERQWQCASPDRTLHENADADPVSGLEIKTSGSLEGWGDDGSDDIPLAYRCQALWCLDVIGVTEWRVALLANGSTYREYTIVRDEQAEADLAVMRREAEAFLARLADDDPPPVDAHPATGTTLRALHPDVVDVEVELPEGIAGRYRDAVANARDADERKRAATNLVLFHLGSGRYATCGGEKVATRSVAETTGLDRGRLRTRWPEAWADCKTTTTQTRLTPARKKDSDG